VEPRTAEPVATNGDREPAEDGDRPATTKLFINRGERSGIDEEDLRWALREGAVLPDEAVHDVRVLHRFSFVEVDPDQAERTVEFLDGTKLKGKEIRLEVARS
jgi:ATP-dependent RNA helicase DeaD